MKKRIDFYFDFLSPFSYLAWCWVREHLNDYDFHFYPVSIPSIVAHFKTLGPAQIEPKRDYLFKDLLRFTKLNNIPFNTPKTLPFNALYALRLSLISVAEKHQVAIIDSLFKAGWAEGLDIGNDDVIKEVLFKNQLPVEELFLKMEAKSARVELKNNIELALSKKLFGVPSFLVDEELFWGNDSIKYLEMYLDGRDPLDHELYKKFVTKHPFGK